MRLGCAGEVEIISNLSLTDYLTHFWVVCYLTDFLELWYETRYRLYYRHHHLRALIEPPIE